MSARRGRSTALLLAMLCSGCALPLRSSSGTTYHLIVGIGVVAVSDPDRTAAVVTQAQSVGVAISDRPGLKLGIGYASSTVTSVAEGAEDVRIEAAHYPGGPLTVNVDKADLAPRVTPAP
ncbi:MAG: hypothetical protein SF182_03340 [Deltaproteobacteria bacterium]|nr:hypothetical protein [Deltaproteobacteria bacterium]